MFKNVSRLRQHFCGIDHRCVALDLQYASVYAMGASPKRLFFYDSRAGNGGTAAGREVFSLFFSPCSWNLDAGMLEKRHKRRGVMYSIEVEKINKSFAGRQVLNEVSLSVEKGTICGLVGRNGSGKTVLMKCICGFYTPDSGRIRLRGEIMDRKREITGNMGILLETPGFLEQESARNNLLYLARLNGRIGKKEVEEILVKVGLDPKDRKKVKKYSMGMRQRLGIAQAIMEDQDVLLLDEPMNGLR